MTAPDVAAVLYSSLPDGAAADDLDGLLQADAVAAALRRMGYDVREIPFDLGAAPPGRGAKERLAEAPVARALRAAAPCVVFNLVETVFGTGRWSYLAPALLERLGLACTGSSAGVIFLTTHKIAAKLAMRRLGIPTPPWATGTRTDQFRAGERYIVKALYEDASVGIGPNSVVRFSDAGQLAPYLGSRLEETGREHFAEQYIDGREFSIALLGDGGEPQILAPAEMRFRGYEEKNRPRIVDYRAKWETGSFEYTNTFSVHRFAPEDGALIAEMRAISLACWARLGLRGYARVDFRVDPSGRPWVLEINCNPCITPGGSGFLAAAAESGLGFDEVVRRIVAEALDEGAPPCAEGAGAMG